MDSKEKINAIYGKNGTGFTPIETLKYCNYHGKVRVWELDKKLYRPQSFWLDFIHIIGTHSLWILTRKIIKIK